MNSLAFNKNLPELNLGHFWPESLSYGVTRAAPGCHGIDSFSVEVRPSHYITLFMSMKCSDPT